MGEFVVTIYGPEWEEDRAVFIAGRFQGLMSASNPLRLELAELAEQAELTDGKYRLWFLKSVEGKRLRDLDASDVIDIDRINNTAQSTIDGFVNVPTGDGDLEVVVRLGPVWKPTKGYVYLPYPYRAMATAYLTKYQIPRYSKYDGSRFSPNMWAKISQDKYLAIRGQLPKKEIPISQLRTADVMTGSGPPSTRETTRTEVFIGSETITLANPDSDITLTRTIRAIREWSKTVTIDTEHMYGLSGEIQGGPAWLKVKAAAETHLRKTYGISEGMVERYEEELAVQIPPHSNSKLRLDWKEIWQNGEVSFHDDTHGVIKIPYRVLIRITFDQHS